MTRKFDGNHLLIATHNRGKMTEFEKLLAGRDIQFTCNADHDLPEPEETEDTFIGNATIKALAATKATGLPALADDSGMCVKSLNGAPGVYSADWAGEPRDFKKAMQRVWDELGDAQDRSAYFTSCLVLAFPDGHIESVEGRANGTIVWPPRTEGGFGYDPIFMPDGHDITYAEMTPAQKNAISHRAIAFDLMMKKCF